ncbi:MAG: hypothetical protein Q9160_002103 [Pyrenula sp. 1 TL-2023]
MFSYLARSLLLAIASLRYANALPAGEATINSPNKFYVAIGDSYPVGIGAGKLLPPPFGINGCFRTDKSYPWLVREQFYKGDDEFSFHACNGQNIQDINNFQIKGFGTEKASLVTVQVGGNNVGFADILRKCVYGLDVRGQSCPDLLSASRTAIDGRDFHDLMDGMLSSLASTAPRDSFKLFIGYASFFNVDVVSNNLPNYCNTPKDTRVAINGLVARLNHVIKPIVEAHEGFFIEPDTSGLWDGHRYCDSGLQYFQYLPTWDAAEKGLFHPSEGGHAAYASLINVVRATHLREQEAGKMRSKREVVETAMERVRRGKVV